jgi:hypothetical protein
MLARKVITPGVHAAIVTSGPPHMLHEAGRRLSRDTGLPFVMDMRDPWRLAERLHEYLASPVWYWLAAYHERRCVDQAALVVTNTEPFRRAMCETYPQARDRIITVMNGFDDDPIPPSRHSRRFIIAYGGAIYLDRDPRILFRAAGHVIDELKLQPDDFGIEFVGHVDQYGSAPVTAIAHQEGIERFVRLFPPRSRRAVMEFLAGATMLVSLPQDNDLAIPAKIFEYACFDAWILALAEQSSATAAVLQHTGADVVAPKDLDGIVAVLRKRYGEFAEGVRPTRIAQDRLSRRGQAQILMEALARCVDGDWHVAGERQAVDRLPEHRISSSRS